MLQFLIPSYMHHIRHLYFDIILCLIFNSHDTVPNCLVPYLLPDITSCPKCCYICHSEPTGHING